MGKYARELPNMEKSCKARGTDLRVHYKNTHETCMAIKGKGLEEAQKYLNAVVAGKRYARRRGIRAAPGPSRRRAGAGARPRLRSRPLANAAACASRCARRRPLTSPPLGRRAATGASPSESTAAAWAAPRRRRTRAARTARAGGP